MDYIIYIVLAILGVIYFIGQGFAKKKSRERKSRRFMEDYQKKESKETSDQ
ncbi:hypothetical protein [Arenibacter aquaticus]|uniref:hypothetical protein n=1 Tax=Arenibacter aquaticus TaxID=2489054 RepID=UPI00192E6470|nr:hypothetical protein [Arenibacter aquaticus]